VIDSRLGVMRVLWWWPSVFCFTLSGFLARIAARTVAVKEVSVKYGACPVQKCKYTFFYCQ